MPTKLTTSMGQTLAPNMAKGNRTICAHLTIIRDYIRTAVEEGGNPKLLKPILKEIKEIQYKSGRMDLGLLARQKLMKKYDIEDEYQKNKNQIKKEVLSELANIEGC